MSPEYSYLRVEKHQIKPSNKYYKLLDELCFKSKNLYNTGLYVERQAFLEKDQNLKSIRFIQEFTLINYLKESEPFKALPSVISQQILKKVTQNFQSFFKATKDYNKNPEKYLGKPKLPKYRDSKSGRFPLILTYVTFRFNKEHITFHKGLKGFKVKTHLNPEKHTLREARFIPHKTYITLEVVYEIKEEPLEVPTDFKYLAGIDLGIDNFSTISILKPDTNPLIINGKGLKSYNKYFNKKLDYLKSKDKLKNNKYTTKRIQRLIKKRNNYIDTWIHKASRLTANYLYKNKVKEVIIGKNKNWKQNSKLSKLSKKINQTFIQIPFESYIQRLTYKCQDLGIKVYIVEESYTSGTSYLDNEIPIKDFYNKNRRIQRGLFKTNKNKLINSDVNAALQIVKKVYRTDYKPSYRLRINPRIINVA